MPTLFSIFEKNVSSYGAKPAFISLESGSERVISYNDLWEMVCAKASLETIFDLKRLNSELADDKEIELL